MAKKAIRKTHFPVGIIIKSHGLKGEVKVRPLASSTDFLANGLELVANYPTGKTRPLKIQGIRSQGRFLLLTFDGISDRNMSETLQGAELTVNREALPPLAEGEFYLGDLIGYLVVSNEENLLGEVQEVWDLPANEVLRVINEDREILIPMVDDIIESIDHEQQRVTIQVMDGLLD
jgi:16S rRNA processing protein RimM